ncbi:MAG: SET domain-containing protein [Promethearchaeota archaeon]|jgi:SET domain-containing protein
MMITTDIPYNPKSINQILKFAEVKRSEIHGLGLFAKKLIPKGTVWWHARAQDVLIVTKQQFQVLDSSNKSPFINDYLNALLTYSYYDMELDALVFCLDDAKFVNHSYNPNTGSIDETSVNSIASRDIQQGEEITEDYTTYIKCEWLEKYKKYFDPTCW